MLFFFRRNAMRKDMYRPIGEAITMLTANTPNIFIKNWMYIVVAIINYCSLCYLINWLGREYSMPLQPNWSWWHRKTVNNRHNLKLPRAILSHGTRWLASEWSSPRPAFNLLINQNPALSQQILPLNDGVTETISWLTQTTDPVIYCDIYCYSPHMRL